MALKLVIGNKNYSSWSMRPWLALRANNIAFEEVFIPLYTGDADKQRILDFTHSGKVPALIDGDVTIWDSLAIIEYAAERFPDARLWPEDRACAGACAFDFGGDAFGLHGAAQRMRHEPAPAGPRDRAVGRCARQRRAHPADLDRVPRALPKARAVPVRKLLARADAMFAPVVHRFRTYAIPVEPEAQAYMDTMMALPAFQEWTRAGLAETLVIEKFETV